MGNILKRSGSGPSVENKAPNVSVKSEHDTYVELAREFVEELVEKLPDSSGKSVQPAKCLDVEDSTSLTSVVLSEKSCDTLPDLLQPESVYKKQADTDTDTSHTTEYESAVETDVQDSSSLNDGLLSDEIFGSAENIVDQQLKCQQGDQVVNSVEACILQNGDDLCNETITLDGSSQILSCSHIEEKSDGGSTLIPLDIVTESNLLSDCVTFGESSYITSSSSPGDITVLCTGLANLELNSSLEYPNVLTETSTCSGGEKIADSSLVGCELDTIHLIETDEHELSVLVVDNTVDISAIPELTNTLSIVTDPSIQNTENIVDDLNSDTCKSFQDDNRNTLLDFLPCNREVNTVYPNPTADALVEKVECVEKPIFAETSCNEELECCKKPIFEATSCNEDVEKPICEATSCNEENIDVEVPGLKEENIDVEVSGLKEENINVELNKEYCGQGLNVTFDAQIQSVNLSYTRDKEVFNLSCNSANEPLLGNSSSGVHDLNSSVKEFKDSLVEEIDLSCKSEKELIDKILTTVAEEKTPDPKINPVPEEEEKLVTEGISLGCEFKESIVNELLCSEAQTQPTVHTAVCNLVNKEVTVEHSLCYSDDQVEKPVEEAPVAIDLIEQKSAVNIPEVVTASVKVCDLVNKEVTVEHSLCYSDDQVEKPVEEAPVAINLIEQKSAVNIPEVATASVKVSRILPPTWEHIDRVFVQTHKEEVVNIVQATPSGTSLDFDNLAAEAANVSNDFLTASQEVIEPDFVGESESTVLLQNCVIMTDTGSTHRPDENVGSLPLDVKWLADSQNNSHKNRSSNISSPKTSDVSPRSKINSSPHVDSRSSVIDCTIEDPFKRRSLLQNSPPRDVLHTDDNKCQMPVQSTIRMEKGAGESSDIKENHSEAGPDTAETFSIPGEEIFKDSSAFEFLSSMASTQPLRDYRKESLYVKFDPLVGSAPVARTDRNIPLPSISQDTIVSGDTPPHVKISNSPRHVTPVKNPALDLIDRLISLSPSPKKPESPKPPPVVKQEPVNVERTPKEWDAMVEELHVLRELLDREDIKHQDEILKYKAEVEAIQNKLNIIQQRNQEAEEREQKLNKKIIDKAQGQKQMSMIMEEYEKTISRLVAEKEAEHQAHELEKESLTKDKDLALGHLTNIEIAFSDVHMKYERSKNVIEGFKKNEEVLRASLADYESTIRKQEQKYEMLKSHAMQQLECANQELEAVKKSQQAENAKLKAMLKKSELKTSSLEEMLDQKIKENQELASICDDLISKVGN